jgi:diguanylate cyclase (GGDEF)-like protein
LGASLLGALADRSGLRLGCLILDLDHFKSVNDNHGHEAGDRVLIAVARRVQQVARQGDLFVRLGGEEFAVFTVVRSAKELRLVGERLRAAVEDLEVQPRITTSVGGALLASGAELRLEELMSRADRQLYDAKAAGRNATRVASD